MNELDPDLKRLLKWAREASPSSPEQAPPGFSSRVVASANGPQALTLFEELQQAGWAIGCAALALILCGGLVLASQRPAPEPAAEISTVMNQFAANLPR